MLGCEAAFCQGRPNLILGIGRKFLPDLIQTGVGIAGSHFLFKISDGQVISQLYGTGQGRSQSQDAL